MRPAQSHDRLGLSLAYRPWHHLRRVRMFLQPGGAALKVAPPPLVRGLAADAEVRAQLAHALLRRRQRRHQSYLLVHRTDLPPRHRLAPPAVSFNLLPILPVCTRADLSSDKERLRTGAKARPRDFAILLTLGAGVTP